MANWVRLNQDQAKDIFAEATGALGILANYQRVREVVLETEKLGPGQYIDRELNILLSALFSTTVASFGTFSFVLVYERYKKECNRYPGRQLNPSEAFGLHIYTDHDGSALRERYPATIIDTWVPDPNKPTWFADVLRNSFAHGQSKTKMEGDRLGVELTNTRDGHTLNFAIFMTQQDFGNLVASALRPFITAVVDGGVYEPLSSLLMYEL